MSDDSSFIDDEPASDDSSYDEEQVAAQLAEDILVCADEMGYGLAISCDTDFAEFEAAVADLVDVYFYKL